ncbi:class I SAM-dependent methyltransferase [Nodosilinea sp. LEGE 07298]|nr:class I SAM-dependent methyltransferase [Nodosilinea sp. LEGE 07298]
MSESTVRQQYNELASVYDRRWQHYIAKMLRFLKQWAMIPAEARVLDLACGTGEFERLLLQDSPDQLITGIDISEQMLAIAHQKLKPYPNVSLQLATASDLPFADRSFDVIVSANSFHYFDNPELALKEIKRVVTPGGRVVILDWCKDYFVCRVCDALLQRFDPAHQQCYTQAEFHHSLNATGFKIQQATKGRFGLIWGLMVVTAVP